MQLLSLVMGVSRPRSEDAAERLLVESEGEILQVLGGLVYGEFPPGQRLQFLFEIEVDAGREGLPMDVRLTLAGPAIDRSGNRAGHMEATIIAGMRMHPDVPALTLCDWSIPITLDGPGELLCIIGVDGEPIGERVYAVAEARP